jgi:hypothetical protein
VVSSGSVAEVYRASWAPCLRLWLVSSIALSALGLVLVPYRVAIVDGLAGLFLPGDWIASMRLANDALFYRVGSVLLFQTVAIVCFSAVSLFFFPFRDRISVATESRLTGQRVSSPGLHRELWLEAGLVLIAFNLYSFTYLLAYFLGQPLFGYIDELAFVLLLLFFLVDLLSPVYFRRNRSCLHVFRALRQNPLRLLLFGAAFCAPVYLLELLLGGLVYQQENNLGLSLALVAIITVNCAVAVFALPLGTWLAVEALQRPGSTDRPFSGLMRPRVFYGIQMVFALLLLGFYGSVVAVLSNKVPLKSAQYTIQWSSLAYEAGTDDAPPTLRFDMLVVNRHPTLGLEVDHADLLLNLEGHYLGEAALNIPYVPPDTAALVPVELKLGVDFSQLAGIAWQETLSLFSGDEAAWRDNIQARLTVQLPLGLRLPLYLTEGYRHEFKES